MGKKRNKAIKVVIQMNTPDIAHNDIIAVDKDGEVFTYTSPIEYDDYECIWESIVSIGAVNIGKVKPFNGDGWKKSLWNTNGVKIKL